MSEQHTDTLGGSAWDRELAFYGDMGIVPYPRSLLPEDYATKAERFAREAVTELGLPMFVADDGWPAVRFFLRTKSGRPNPGWFDAASPHLVFIAADLRDDELREVVRHETHHFCKTLVGEPVFETEADAFAKDSRESADWRIPQRRVHRHMQHV